MKTYNVSLTKAYTVRIKAKNTYDAKELSQFFTDDIKDLSTDKDRKDNKFNIENIECKMNDVFDVKEIDETN